MRIAIFTHGDILSGGNFRLLKVLIRFPRDNIILIMPRNRKNTLLNNVTRYIHDLNEKEKIISILNDAITLKDLKDGNAIYYINYGSYIAKAAKDEDAELLYFPHEHAYFPLGFRRVNIPWTELLQLTPVIGSLSIENDKGFSLFIKNVKNNYGYNTLKALRSYIRFQLFKYAIKGVKLLAVSESISYELNKLGVHANIKIIKPGIGVDPCPYKDLNKDIDILYYSRVVPEKGIFDFIELLKKLNNIRMRFNAVIAGFANNDMAKNVEQKINEMGINDRVKLRFNLDRENALKLLASAKVLIYPSKLDAFPLVVLEALSCSTPVIAYNIPAIRFNFNDTNAVIKVPPNDIDTLTKKVIEFISNEEWIKLSREAINYSSMFTWDAVAKSEWSILTNLNNE